MKKIEFDRTFYLKALVKRKHNGLVKIVTGIRRCGKSYLLTNLFKRHLLSDGIAEDHIVEINLEDKKTRTSNTRNRGTTSTSNGFVAMRSIGQQVADQ